MIDTMMRCFPCSIMSLPEAGILGAEGGYPSSYLSICFIILQSNSLPYAMYLFNRHLCPPMDKCNIWG